MTLDEKLAAYNELQKKLLELEQDILSATWQELAEKGQKSLAMKRYGRDHQCSLEESRRAVERWV
ncbi:MAG TPA: hypothetical protein PKC23_09410 [Candidatus Desulfobacillus sp.]|nr:hypothetical protein [Candidatus Desulfobacillus sp.]